MVDVVRNPQKSNVYAYEIKRVRCVGVYSGMMYGCVRYVFRVSASSSLSAFLLLLLLLMLLLLLLVVLLPSVRIHKHLFHFPFDEIYRRLIFFHSRAFCFLVIRLFHDYMKQSNTTT